LGNHNFAYPLCLKNCVKKFFFILIINIDSDNNMRNCDSRLSYNWHSLCESLDICAFYAIVNISGSMQVANIYVYHIVDFWHIYRGNFQSPLLPSKQQTIFNHRLCSVTISENSPYRRPKVKVFYSRMIFENKFVRSHLEKILWIIEK